MLITDFIFRNFDGLVQVSPEVSYTLRDVMNKNVQYFNRQFEQPFYADGMEKLFYPLSYIMARTLFENTDIDTKDMSLNAENPSSVDVTAIIKPAVRQHMKDSDFGEVLNQTRQELINMGHVILKEVDGESRIVDVRNIVRPANAMNIQDCSFAERILMTWEDMLANKAEWEHCWDEIEELHEVMVGSLQPIADAAGKVTGYQTSKGRKISPMSDTVTTTLAGGEGDNYFVVYEYWTHDNFRVGKRELITKGVIKYLDCQILRPEDDKEWDWIAHRELERFASPYSERVRNAARLEKLKKQGQIVNGDEVRIYPYEEQRLVTVPGRWLGVGTYELTAPMQEQFNEIMNDKRRYDQLVHKGIIVHRQPSNGESTGLTQEFINALPTGAVISIEQDEDLTRLNLGSMVNDFIASADKIFELARQVAGVTASGTGEELPASTTATIGVINQQKAKTTFDIVIEQQSLFLKRVFEKFKLKSIINELTTKEWVQLLGDPMELNAVEEKYVENYAHSLINDAIERGELVQDGEIEKLVQSIQDDRASRPRFAQFKKDLVKNLRTTVEFVVTNESFDKLNRIRELQQAIQNAMSNPYNTLSIQRLQEELLDLLNLSGSKYRMTEQELKAKAEAEQRQAELQLAGRGTPQQNGQVLSQGQEFGNANGQ